MKTLILNDTRSAEHVGCELVMTNTLAECRRVGIEVVAMWTTQDCQTSLIDRLEVEAKTFDSVLINGEGSMHHDRPVPTHLCEAACWARKRAKKVVLYNSLWQENASLNRYLEDFDRVYCRDSGSAEEVRSAGVSCETVPDMVFTSTFSPGDARHRDSLNEVTVIDSIERKKSERLSKFAAYHGFPFLHMDRVGYERLKKSFFVRTGGYFQGADRVEAFVRTLRAGQRVLSGRFHGTCLAMVLGLPVVSISSNTTKLEALHRDAGLPGGLVLSEVPKRFNHLDAAFAEAADCLAQISAFVDHARTGIHGMFDDIAEVFRSES